LYFIGRAGSRPLDATMSNPAEFTGERYLPGVTGEIAYEHWHRYAFSRRFVAGKRVLDAACGEGYGTALLADGAATVVGVDIDAGVIAAARDAYAQRANVRFETSSVTLLPIADASIDVVVSFETIEHISAHDQTLMLAEFARVLAPQGLLILSSPNKLRYSDQRDYANPFHRRELYRGDLEALLDRDFRFRQWYRQAPAYVSTIWGEDDAHGFDAAAGDGRAVDTMPLPEALYFVVIAAKEASALPPSAPKLSIFGDRDESELARVEAQAREVLRQDLLVKERDAALDRQTAQIQHLERLVAYRERIVEERDGQLAALNAAREEQERALVHARDALVQRDGEAREARRRIAVLEDQNDSLIADQGRLDAALAAQERIIAYRQTLGWWWRLPWLRAKLAWQRLHGR
jgi:SAM-dependent methyltransferase